MSFYEIVKITVATLSVIIVLSIIASRFFNYFTYELWKNDGNKDNINVLYFSGLLIIIGISASIIADFIGYNSFASGILAEMLGSAISFVIIGVIFQRLETKQQQTRIEIQKQQEETQSQLAKQKIETFFQLEQQQQKTQEQLEQQQQKTQEQLEQQKQETFIHLEKQQRDTQKQLSKQADLQVETKRLVDKLITLYEEQRPDNRTLSEFADDLSVTTDVVKYETEHNVSQQSMKQLIDKISLLYSHSDDGNKSLDEFTRDLSVETKNIADELDANLRSEIIGELGADGIANERIIQQALNLYRKKRSAL